MKATIKHFFGSNLEQEVMDEVVILPAALRPTATGTINLPVGEWTDFEKIEVHFSSNTSLPIQVVAYAEIDRRILKADRNTWQLNGTFADGNNNNQLRCTIKATGSNTATWTGTAWINNASQALAVYPCLMVGYKRRYSRVGIDELMSAMSLPNLIANADLTDNPINQRGFDGNWAALAVGDYGYDQWMKVSSTHMGAVIEAGKYRPNAKHTLTKDDVVIGEFMSPASGHWTVAVPFATSGKFDLYAGQFKRPWHPVENALIRCARYYEAVYIDASGHAYSNGDCRGVVIPMLAPKRKPVTLPTVHVNVFATTSSGAGVNFGGSFENWAMFPTYITPTHLGNARNIAVAIGGGDGTVFAFSCRQNPLVVDVSITLEEVNSNIIYLQ
ncbi:hypothetical protein ACYVOT_003374 [Vibrio cholerae]